MANVLVRSPFYVSKKDLGGTASYGILTISVDGVSVYTLRKDVVSTWILFEIAELLRDYLDIQYTTTNLHATHSQPYSTSLQLYTSAGATVGLPDVNSGFIIDGYGLFLEGSNPTTTRGYMQSNDIIYRLGDSDLRIPVDRNNTTQVTFAYNGNITYTKAIATSTDYVFEYVSNTAFGYDSFKDRVVAAGAEYEDNQCIQDFLDEVETILVDELYIETTDGLRVVKVNTIDECKFIPAKVSFINRWGALQDLWFFKKSVQQLDVSREEYKRFNVSVSGTYDTREHPRRTYNVQGQKKITLNTGYVDESYNDLVEELLQSNQVWIEQDTVIWPVVVDSSSLTYKTSVNDRLVDYQLAFSYAYDNIQNIR